MGPPAPSASWLCPARDLRLLCVRLESAELALVPLSPDHPPRPFISLGLGRKEMHTTENMEPSSKEGEEGQRTAPKSVSQAQVSVAQVRPDL